jgi:uncharacterized membrane protein
MDSDEELRRIARKRAEEKVGFYMHFAIYVGVNLFLISLWYFTGAGFPWFIFPLFGWGIAVAAHYVGAFRGHAYTETLAEQEYQRLKEKRQ